MVVGALALGIGFLSAPNTVEEAKAMVADAHGHGGHGGNGGNCGNGRKRGHCGKGGHGWKS